MGRLGDNRRMADPAPRPTLRLVLDVDTATQPITGLFAGPGLDATPFRGWIDLVALLDEALSAEARAGDIRPELI